MNFLHHFFIPSEKNNFRAKLIHIDFLSVYLVAIILLTSVYKTNIVPKSIGSILGVATNISIDAIFQTTNQRRTENGLPALSRNAALDDAARRKAKYMFDNNLWAHYGRDGTTPWSFITEAGYKYIYAGENLAQNFMLSNDVVNAWMTSPSHRENVLNANFSDVGYAVVNGTLNGQETTLVVQMFGRPQSTTSPLVRKVSAQARTTKVSAQTQKVVTIPTTSNPQTKSVPQRLAAATSAIPIPYTSTFLIFSLLLITFAFDFYFAYRLRLVRISSKHLAHFIFIGFILISLAIISKGIIL